MYFTCHHAELLQIICLINLGKATTTNELDEKVASLWSNGGEVIETRTILVALSLNLTNVSAFVYLQLFESCSKSLFLLLDVIEAQFVHRLLLVELKNVILVNVAVAHFLFEGGLQFLDNLSFLFNKQFLVLQILLIALQINEGLSRCPLLLYIDSVDAWRNGAQSLAFLAQLFPCQLALHLRSFSEILEKCLWVALTLHEELHLGLFQLLRLIFEVPLLVFVGLYGIAQQALGLLQLALYLRNVIVRRIRLCECSFPTSGVTSTLPTPPGARCTA
mmetsp:Transcript_7035/g.26365  ORF Transcript_7035/g.26365 Transcript_7035/m.26365 type:complete len:276 (+) Transcript_7035:897-1724(+)